jgi:hypothetical protein
MGPRNGLDAVEKQKQKQTPAFQPQAHPYID